MPNIEDAGTGAAVPVLPEENRSVGSAAAEALSDRIAVRNRVKEIDRREKVRSKAKGNPKRAPTGR